MCRWAATRWPSRKAPPLTALGPTLWASLSSPASSARASGKTPQRPFSAAEKNFCFGAIEAQRWDRSPPAGIRDPGTLADDDGRFYIVFGSCSGPVQPDDCCYYAAELEENMTSHKPPVHLSVHGPPPTHALSSRKYLSRTRPHIYHQNDVHLRKLSKPRNI